MSDDARRFYTERFPTQFNDMLEQTLAQQGPDGATYQGLISVNGTIEVEIDGAPNVFHLNIEAGRMAAGQTRAHEPFLTLQHDAAACEAIARESGDSALGFLGALAGLGQPIHLTRARVDQLRQVAGTVGLTLTGPGGFCLRAHFGGGPPAAEPDCDLILDREIYAQLRAGEIDPQDAFMGGKIEINGDMQVAMQLALAVLSPD